MTRGADTGGYYHELFLRGKTFLCKRMTRTKVKGTRFKAASSPEQEPDFYSMAPVVVTPPNSSDEEMSHDTTLHASAVYPLEAAASSYMVNQSLSLEPYPIDYQTYAADPVLDEAVDELILGEDVDRNVVEFVQDWDPTFAASLDNDIQLGFLLDRILDD